MKYFVTAALLFALTGLAPAQSYVYFTFDAPGATATVVTGTNNAGQAVRSSTDAEGTHNFLRTCTTYTTIDLVGATPGATPGATTIGWINNVGQIAGTYIDSTSGFARCYMAVPSGQTFDDSAAVIVNVNGAAVPPGPVPTFFTLPVQQP